MRSLYVLLIVALAGCEVASRNTTEIEHLTTIDGLLQAQRWCELRAYLVANPTMLDGRGDLASELREFVSQSQLRCDLGDKEEIAAQDLPVQEPSPTPGRDHGSDGLVELDLGPVGLSLGL